MKKREYIGALLAVAASFICADVNAQQGAFPMRPITLVVPNAAGGPSDLFARPFAQELSRRLGQPVVIENKPGANGGIGAAYVAKTQKADGYTLLLVGSSVLTINPHLYRGQQYDPKGDFQPISMLYQTPNVLVVPANSPYTSVRDLVSAAKAKPGSLSFGSAGNGNTMHLMGLQFQSRTGTSIVHVPYKGSGPALTDVMAGQIPMMFNNLSAVAGLHKAGRVRVLAVGDDKRSSLLPDVPTMTEAGASGVAVTPWAALLVRSGTDPQIVNHLLSVTHAILAAPDFRKNLEAQGFEILSTSPNDVKERLVSESETYKKLVTDWHVTID